MDRAFRNAELRSKELSISVPEASTSIEKNVHSISAIASRASECYCLWLQNNDPALEGRSIRQFFPSKLPVQLGKFVLPKYLAHTYNKPLSLATGMQVSCKTEQTGVHVSKAVLFTVDFPTL
jgi:hypothetical protein